MDGWEGNGCSKMAVDGGLRECRIRIITHARLLACRIIEDIGDIDCKGLETTDKVIDYFNPPILTERVVGSIHVGDGNQQLSDCISLDCKKYFISHSINIASIDMNSLRCTTDRCNVHIGIIELNISLNIQQHGLNCHNSRSNYCSSQPIPCQIEATLHIL